MKCNCVPIKSIIDLLNEEAEAVKKLNELRGLQTYNLEYYDKCKRDLESGVERFPGYANYMKAELDVITEDIKKPMPV